MKVIVSVTSGTDDPTRATLGMLAAKVAVEQGHDVVVWFQGEAATIVNKNVYPVIQGVNMPAVKGVMDFLVQKNVPLWVCEACAKARNVGPENWVETAMYKGMGDYIGAVTSFDKNIDF